ncbi:hypothetical protein FB385_1633 [Paramicrobacterium agarici]|nr:hypothetical protein FB385_1633 [Microbacterium agarici]
MSYGVPDPRAEKGPNAKDEGDDMTNGEPDPNRNKPSQAEGTDGEADTVSPEDPAENKPSQAEGDVGDFGDEVTPPKE